MPDKTSKHPVARESDKNISITKKKQEEFVDSLTAKVESDLRNRESHMAKLTHWKARRYQEYGKDVTWPWPGASDWRSPVIDAEVNKSKSQLLSVFAADPICSFIPMSVEAMDKADAAEQTMQWLLRSRMRNVEDTFEQLYDTSEEGGYSYAKITYEYKTSIISETIRKAELDPEIILQVGEANAAVINGLAEPEAFEEELTIYISEKFGLNVKDSVDFKAIDEVINFILTGKDEVSIKRREVSHDAPHISNIDPSLLVAETGTKCLQDAERITEIKFQSLNDIKSLARDGYYDMKAVEKIVKSAEELDEMDDVRGDGSRQFGDLINSTYEQLRANREGLVLTDKNDLFRLHETYTLYDIDNDGVKERVVIIYHPGTGAVLRFMEFPYEHGMWPYVQIRSEDNDGRLYSPRGIPERIDQIDKWLTETKRNKMNGQRIANSITMKYKVGSNINPNNFTHTPGSWYPVINMDDIQQLNINSKDFSYDNEEQNLQFWVERVLGSTDLALQSKGGSEARTRAEVNLVAGIGQQATTMKVSRAQRYNKMIFEQVWALWLQYGPEDFIISQSLGEIRPLSRHEIQGKFDLQPVGTAGELNPDIKYQRAQQRFQTISYLIETGMAGQLGDEYELDIGAAFKDLMDKDDKIASNKILRKRTPQEIQQIQAQRAQAEAQAAQQQAMMDNQPMSVQDLRAQVKQLKKDAPNGGAQQVSF